MLAKPLPSSSWSIGVLVVAAVIALWTSHARAENWGGTKVTGSGVAKTETRAATGVRGIALGVHARLELRQGGAEGLTITGDDNIVPLIETIVENGTLQIRWAGNGNFAAQYKDLEIVVDAKNIEGLTIGGSGKIHAAQLKAGDLRADVAGSGGIAIDKLEASSFNVNIAGSGDIAAAGRVDSLDVTLSGSGDLKAAKLESRTARIALQGSGDATVWATERLNATVAGSGDIRYYGKPQVRRIVAGSGSVLPAGGAS